MEKVALSSDGYDRIHVSRMNNRHTRNQTLKHQGATIFKTFNVKDSKLARRSCLSFLGRDTRTNTTNTSICACKDKQSVISVMMKIVDDINNTSTVYDKPNHSILPLKRTHAEFKTNDFDRLGTIDTILEPPHKKPNIAIVAEPLFKAPKSGFCGACGVNKPNKFFKHCPYCNEPYHDNHY